ncbi:recombinase family protein [Patescibacteria group bacterium]|nr:recombinase family protein [Patescibacteria group bacterium]
MTRAAIYARVSTEERTDQNQVDVLEKWAADRGWAVTDIYRDVGSAWQNADQKELRRLLEDCRLGKVQMVVIWDLSRFTRRGVFETLQMVRRFADLKVDIASYQDSWLESMQIPGVRDFLIGFLGYVNSEYSRQLSERTKAGMERARSEGKQIGRPRGRKDSKKRARAGYFKRDG